jgi:polyvinyl alcohol dehydrogenase (cytochrome)
MLRPLSIVTCAVALVALSTLAQNPGSIPTKRPVKQEPSDWPMYNHDVLGTRFNPAETTLTRESVKGLKIKWVFPTKGDVYATPSVVDNIVYAGDTSGTFYALRSAGTLLWKTSGSGSIKFGPITASALVTNREREVDKMDKMDEGDRRDEGDRIDGMVIFGDQTGFLYGLKRDTGELVWAVQPNHNSAAAIFGSPILVDGHAVIGISSNLVSAATTLRGSVVSLDPDNGRIIWQTYLITDQEQKRGSSGAGVWSTPTYDAENDMVYVTTGNNYTKPATATSDAFVALKGKNGMIAWKTQLVANDTGQIEADFGDSPHIYTISNGTTVEKVVGAGEKETGKYWVLDAATGDMVGSIQAVPSCAGSEGLFATGAVSEGVVFVNGVNCKIQSIPPTGAVIALKSESDASGKLEMEKLWDFTSHLGGAPVLSGLAVANGVVYFHTSGFSSTLFALNTTTGKMLAQVPTSGGISGPSVSNGQIYLGTGTLFASGVATTTSIVAIGL